MVTESLCEIAIRNNKKKVDKQTIIYDDQITSGYIVNTITKVDRKKL
jgi:hypothetical protein